MDAITPLFFELTALDFLVLLVIGVAWSSVVWVLTEWFKGWVGLERPYGRAVLLGPIAFSALVAIPAFPIVLLGVGQPATHSPELAALSLAVGAVGGIGSKIAHDRARGLMDAALERVTKTIRG